MNREIKLAVARDLTKLAEQLVTAQGNLTAQHLKKILETYQSATDEVAKLIKEAGFDFDFADNATKKIMAAITKEVERLEFIERSF